MGNLTSILAVWGAIISTLTLCWNIRRWKEDGVRVIVKTGVYEFPLGEGIEIEIRNLGGKRTMIEQLRLTKFFEGYLGLVGGREHEEYSSNVFKETVQLPCVLEPNAVWKGRVPFEDECGFGRLDKRGLLAKGRLYCRIFCGHDVKPITVRISSRYFDSF